MNKKADGLTPLIIEVLASRLTDEFGRGFSKRNLDNMRRSFLEYSDRLPPIVHKPSAQLAAGEIFQSPTEKLSLPSSIGQTASDQLGIIQSLRPSKKLLRAKLVEWAREEEAKA